MDDSYLPPIHRKDEERPNHDDWPIGLKWVPRTWFSFPQSYAPKQILGNQDYFNMCQFFSSNQDSYKGMKNCWPLFGPKPIPPKLNWQFSLAYPKILGLTIPFPYFASTWNKFTFYVGMRWSEAGQERYYELAFPTLKRIV